MGQDRRISTNNKKQEEFDSLSAKITRATYKVDQLTAIVSSLTDKQGSFEMALSRADDRRSTTEADLNMVKALVAGVKEMGRKVERVAQQTSDANTEIIVAAKRVSELINSLIYSVEVIDRLALVINKKQASKKLISAELVAIANTASADANKAIALTLTALESCHITVVSGTEAGSITLLEQVRNLELFGFIVGDSSDDTKTIEKEIRAIKNSSEKEAPPSTFFGRYQERAPAKGSLQKLFEDASQGAIAGYSKDQEALARVKRELIQAEANLVSARVIRDSLKAGLAAATAAALAA